MAQPVPFRRYLPEDKREDVAKQLAEAPKDHAPAVLSGYQLLQQLHDTGTLDLLRGMLGAGDAVVNHVVDIVSAPEMVNILRSMLALGTLVSEIDPQALHEAIEDRPEDRAKKAPSLWAIGRKMRTEEARIGIGVAVSLLTLLGGAVKNRRGTVSD